MQQHKEPRYVLYLIFVAFVCITGLFAATTIVYNIVVEGSFGYDALRPNVCTFQSQACSELNGIFYFYYFFFFKILFNQFFHIKLFGGILFLILMVIQVEIDILQLLEQLMVLILLM